MVIWTNRRDHLARLGVTVEQAEESLNDADRVVFNPDPASQSGKSVRTIGYSRQARAVLCVVTVTVSGVKYGVTYGATAFKANPKYQLIYKEAGNG
ncbi:transposase [uncultured Mycobacterium sp.]|uniref:transposase n=1 Tax=uncultured Mycobacterium sp. TaxID=171292 RepID=UPI0035CBD74D